MSSFSEDEECLGIENISNGLILSNSFLPEVMLNILIHVSWKDLILCRLVCQSWKLKIDNLVCFEKLKISNFKTLTESFTGPLTKLKSDGVPFHLYFAISKGAFGKNLLKNAFGSGDDPHVCQRRPRLRRDNTGYINHRLCSQNDCPRYKHWGVLDSPGSGWAVEPEPVGCDPLPPHLPGRSCYVTSYKWCSKEQLITLAEHGLSPKIMDEVRPQFDVSEWYARRRDCGIRYQLQVRLLNSDKGIIQEFEEYTGEDLEDSKWHEVCHSFKDYGPGVRYILFIHGGTDTQFWAGHYGSKIAGGSVIARIPISQFERMSCDSSSLS